MPLQLAGAGDLGNAAVVEQNVFQLVDACRGIDETAVRRICQRVMRGLRFVAIVRSARSITAMRIATPFVTCSRIADCAPSATPAVISMPRMIGPGMQHHRLRRVRCQPLAGELVAGLVLLQIELQPGQPLGLNAQHHHGLRLLERGVEVALDLDAGAGARGLFRQQFFWPAQQHARAQARQQQHVRARNAAVQNVADDHYRHAGERVGLDAGQIRAADASESCAGRAAPAWDARACRRPH